MAGKTISSFKRNVLQNLKLMLTSRGYKWIYHISGDLPNMLEVTRKGKTNYFFIFGGKDEGSQDLVQGITAAGAFFGGGIDAGIICEPGDRTSFGGRL